MRAYGVEFGKQVHLGYYYTLKEALRVAKKQRAFYVDKLKSVYGDTVETKVFEALLEDRWSEYIVKHSRYFFKCTQNAQDF